MGIFRKYVPSPRASAIRRNRWRSRDCEIRIAQLEVGQRRLLELVVACVAENTNMSSCRIASVHSETLSISAASDRDVLSEFGER